MKDSECFDFLKTLTSPEKIQEYLYSVRYNPVAEIKSPKRVIETGIANCFEGSILAAAAFNLKGQEPLILDLVAVNDDDHILALFKKKGYWGAISKSNTPLNEYREPIYRSLRELVMSYFDFYFNKFGQKTLRKYSRSFNLTPFNDRNWITTVEDLEFIEDDLNLTRHYSILKPSIQGKFLRANPRLLKAGFLGAMKAGIYPANEIR